MFKNDFSQPNARKITNILNLFLFTSYYYKLKLIAKLITSLQSFIVIFIPDKVLWLKRKRSNKHK